MNIWLRKWTRTKILYLSICAIGLAAVAIAATLLYGAYTMFLPNSRSSNSTNESSAVSLGVFVSSGPNDMGQIEQFEDRVGKRMAIIQFYYDWEHTLDPKNVQDIIDRGSTPLITWNPREGCGQINSGAYDSDIRRWANSLKSFAPQPVLLRYLHEMNIPAEWSTYPWVAERCGSQAYVVAWRRVHDIFAQAGVSNVQFIWCPNVLYEDEPATSPLRFDQLFPGDGYVDWVCLDGYARSPNQSFSTIFQRSLNELERISTRPIMLAEIGVHGSNDDGDSKARWIDDAFRTQIPLHPRIEAVVWFNMQWGTDDYRVDASPTVIDAFREAIAPAFYSSQLRRLRLPSS